MRRLPLLLPLALLVGCTMGPDYNRPDYTGPVGFRATAATDSTVADLPWWDLFEDPVLVEMIDVALTDNRDLRSALARISEARAQLGIVRADMYPRVDYAAGGFLDWSSESDDAEASGSIALDASYQVDLWGRVKRSNEAAVQELLATEESYRSVTIGLVSAVARSYFLLRDLDNRLLISEQTVEARRLSLEVVKSRFKAGMVAEVDVNQAQIQLYEAEVSVQTFARLRTQTENALSVLLGRPPMDVERGGELGEQLATPDLPKGLPSTLLDRRPDVLAAERRLHAQTARIGVAEALKYPQFTLSGDIGASFSDITSSFAGLGAQLFGPLFNSGENQRRVEVEIARTEQLLNAYEQSFLTALREVEDAFVAVNTYEAELDARRRQLVAADSAAELSWVRYEGGLTSYLEVLDLQRSLFSSQLKASEAHQLRLTSMVQLYQALGGGWVAEQDSVIMNVYADEDESAGNDDSGP